MNIRKPVATPFDSRLEALARSVGEERSLHLGAAIGNTLAIAWEGLETLGALLARAIPRARREKVI